MSFRREAPDSFCGLSLYFQARSTGILASTGDYVALLDADDLVDVVPLDDLDGDR